jgi:urease accessory protein
MALSGHLELVCAPDAAGRSVLRHQSFSAPIHLSKPHWDSGALVVNLMNPTPGLFAGDTIRCSVRVESGASLVLTSPSASRVHTMSTGEALLEQAFEVASGGRLEVWPELLIPQRGAHYRQKTRLQVACGGELLFFEMLAPGRTAMGEVFEYDRLDWETDLEYAGKLIARERYHLKPGDPAVTALRERFSTAYYASAFVISPRLHEQATCWEALEGFHSSEVWLGWSSLAGEPGAWVVKMLAADSVILRKTMAGVRRRLYESLALQEPSLRRT